MKTKYILFIFFITISGIISSQTLEVTEDMIIETPQEYSKILIWNFATLTIKNTTIYMEGEIEVYQSGKLIIDNSTVTRSQHSFLWIGIIMTGGEIEIKNGSIIEYALYGVDLKGDGKLTVSGNNTTFRYNDYGVHLRLYPSSMWDFNPEINIQNAIFENNSYGIEMHKQNGIIEIAHCSFSDNTQAGIFFNEDIPESLVSVNDCKFNGLGYGIYAKELYDLKIEDCVFNNSCYCGIYAVSSTGLEVIGNKFYSNYGVKLENSDCEIKNNNKFTSWHGVFAMSDQPGKGCVKITDGNFFNTKEYAIDLTGMDSYDKSEITGNHFSDCNDAISIEGSNYYIVNDNTFDDNDNPVFASATGYNENEILCNFIDQTSEYGLELKNNNYSTTFMGNYFTFGGLADITIDGTIENHIGDKMHPAENHFSDGSGDIKVSDYTPYFHYFLAPDAAPDTDPDNIAPDDIPESWEIQTNMTYDIPDCEMPSGTIETNFGEWWEYYCELMAEYHNDRNTALYLQIKQLESKLKRQLFYLCYKLGLDYRTMLDIMMQYCETFFSQKMMFYLYLNYGECEKADSILDVIEYTLQEPVGTTQMDTLERISKESFVNINRIGLRYHCDTTEVDTLLKSDTLFKFTEAELATLYQETYRGIPQSAYAKTLYYIGTGELLMFERGERNIEPRSMIDKNNDKVEELSIYPNPVSERLFIVDNGQDLAKKLYIYDIYGKKMIDKNIINVKNGIDVSQLPEGIYVLSIEDSIGNTIKTEKIVINHK